jgi:hypothetical protein
VGGLSASHSLISMLIGTLYLIVMIVAKMNIPAEEKRLIHSIPSNSLANIAKDKVRITLKG